jgi:mevalonate kinase
VLSSEISKRLNCILKRGNKGEKASSGGGGGNGFTLVRKKKEA